MFDPPFTPSRLRQCTAGFAACVFLLAAATALCAAETSPPHVVLIMADDLGYGDVQPLNPDSKVSTPAFNRLAAEGITFTDAHTPSAVCTPTRYGLVTGRYCWRTRLKRGVLNGYGEPLIDADRPTLGSVMAGAGYRTAVVGKWHLGLGLHGDEQSLDLTQPLSHHPGTVGFDHSLVIPASLDFPPYVYFRNGMATEPETVSQPRRPFPPFMRQGPRAKDFDMQGCLDRLTEEAVSVVEQMSGADQPTFLYFPLTAPHKPVLPAERFAGSTELGPYADFLRQVDSVVGRVIGALETAEVLDNTLLIVTSDNGSYMYRLDANQKDHVEEESIQGYRPEHHAANADWRGTKADVWEAGHRVPFFVRLPEGKHAAARVDRVVGLIDVMATLSDLLGVERAAEAGPDSYSFAPLLEDPAADFQRPPLVCHSAAGMFAVRDGKWKLVAGNGSGGREKPRGSPFSEPWMLFDLEQDPGESNNVADAHPEVFARLARDLEEIRGE